MYATLPRCAALTASCSSGQHFASGFLQISPRDEHLCLPLTLPLTGCVEDFHLLVVLQPPQLKNSASHGAHTNSSGDTSGIYQPALRVLWSYSERESSGTKSFECLECRYIENADINGARNILAAGHAVLACGGIVQSSRPSKQEPSDTGLNTVGIPVSFRLVGCQNERG